MGRHKQGLYLIFEGIDGSGKSTQIAALQARLEARELLVLRCFEPTDRPHGQEIRRRARQGPAMTAQDELELFLKDRRQHVHEVLAPAIESGQIILQDRSFYSTVAYQGSREDSPWSMSELFQFNDFAPRPDRVVLLDLPAEEGLARVHSRGQSDSFEKLGRQQRVRQAFLDMADERFVVLDALEDPEKLTEELWIRLEPLLVERGLLS